MSMIKRSDSILVHQFTRKMIITYYTLNIKYSTMIQMCGDMLLFIITEQLLFIFVQLPRVATELKVVLKILKIEN